MHIMSQIIYNPKAQGDERYYRIKGSYRDYTGMVREANREKDIITGMAADSADFKQP